RSCSPRPTSTSSTSDPGAADRRAAIPPGGAAPASQEGGHRDRAPARPGPHPGPGPHLAMDDNASGGAVERVCFLARVRPDRLEEYRAAHRRVWPEMTAALRSAGWANYTIFLADDGLLVGYLETDDYESAPMLRALASVYE